MHYDIQTERLRLRNWKVSDIPEFAAMCADPDVMQHFPATLSLKETSELVRRLSNHYQNHGYTYFAVETIKNNEFIGFTGMMNQTWESEFTPCVDLGWRLKRSAWGNGYATEAARACINHAFEQCGISELLAFTPDKNLPSQQLMKKLGMHHIGNFQHPKLVGDSRFKYCVAYKITLEDELQ